MENTTAVRAATLTACVAAAVGAIAGCSSAPASTSSTSPTHPAIFSPSASASPRPSVTAPATVTGPATTGPATTGPATTRPATTGSASPSVSFTYVLPSRTPSYPTAAPQTGGGGTAGLQDGLLFAAGGAAVLAGIGSLALRRKFKRLRSDDRSDG